VQAIQEIIVKECHSMLIKIHVSSSSAAASSSASVQLLEREPNLYIELVLNLYRKYSKLVTSAFERDLKLDRACLDGCKQFFNNQYANSVLTAVESAELLAKYCHMLLRSGSQLHMRSSVTASSGDDQLFDEALNGVVSFICLFVFEQFCMYSVY